MDTTTQPYDSTQDTHDHIAKVRNGIQAVLLSLQLRGQRHDASKLQPPEKAEFDRTTPLLKALVYGTDEYKAALADLKPALDHHYIHNSHHPEYHAAEFSDGQRRDETFVRINGEEIEQGVAISRMSLLDIIEMLCDWKAAGERHADGGDIMRSIEINTKRFGIDPQLRHILEATARELRMVKK